MSDEKMKELHVTIDGYIGAGKTTLAAVLRAYLESLGMVVTVEGENPHALQVVEDTERTQEGIRLGVLRPRHVVLTVNNTAEVSGTGDAFSDPVSMEMYRRTGEVRDPRKLVAFLFLLLRDQVHAGVVEEMMRNLGEPGQDKLYSNGHLARYAQDLAERLLEDG